MKICFWEMNEVITIIGMSSMERFVDVLENEI